MAYYDTTVVEESIQEVMKTLFEAVIPCCGSSIPAELGQR